MGGLKRKKNWVVLTQANYILNPAHWRYANINKELGEMSNRERRKMYQSLFIYDPRKGEFISVWKAICSGLKPSRVWPRMELSYRQVTNRVPKAPPIKILPGLYASSQIMVSHYTDTRDKDTRKKGGHPIMMRMYIYVEDKEGLTLKGHRFGNKYEPIRQITIPDKAWLERETKLTGLALVSETQMRHLSRELAAKHPSVAPW